MRSNPGIQQAKVEDIVADMLKHAPARCQNVSFFSSSIFRVLKCNFLGLKCA